MCEIFATKVISKLKIQKGAYQQFVSNLCLSIHILYMLLPLQVNSILNFQYGYQISLA